VVDGVIPGNEGRGYVLRRIIRRAIRHGYKLGQKQPFSTSCPDLDKAMGDAYPELRSAKNRVSEVLKQEEERLRGDPGERHGGARHRRSLPGRMAARRETGFRLYDPFGFPVDSPPISAASAA